tara:strand:+ start:281 stop:985 length:705 start_codon:yes stop_codon:yes gene_type:complete
MEARKVHPLMEAYASVYEGYGKKKKGDCVSKSEKGDHNCAKKVCHEQYGEGETIFGQHAVPDENGFVSHYDVQFEHGIVENVSVEDMDILTMEAHGEHVEHEGETISEEDVFDIVKGHLIDEGFADTEEAAIAIMANMSEGWRNGIVESMASAERMKELKKERLSNPAPSVKYPAKPAPYGGARSREFEKRLPRPQSQSARSREFEHGSTRSSDTPSGNLGDGLPRDKKGNMMY